MSAELNGLICSGARRGKDHTYALVEERVPADESLSPDEALAELTLRYFTSHGPATAKDFGWWSSLTQSHIKRALEMIGHQLIREDNAGVGYWSSGEPPRRWARGPQVELVQGYDEYIVGYSQSKRLLDLAGRARSSARSSASVPFNGVLLLDTQVAGQWKRTVGKGSVAIEVVLHEPFDESQTEALRDAVDRHGTFLRRPARFSVL